MLLVNVKTGLGEAYSPCLNGMQVSPVWAPAAQGRPSWYRFQLYNACCNLLLFCLSSFLLGLCRFRKALTVPASMDRYSFVLSYHLSLEQLRGDFLYIPAFTNHYNFLSPCFSPFPVT